MAVGVQEPVGLHGAVRTAAEEAGLVFVNGELRRVRGGEPLRPGDAVTVVAPGGDLTLDVGAVQRRRLARGA